MPQLDNHHIDRKSKRENSFTNLFSFIIMSFLELFQFILIENFALLFEVCLVFQVPPFFAS